MSKTQSISIILVVILLGSIGLTACSAGKANPTVMPPTLKGGRVDLWGMAGEMVEVCLGTSIGSKSNIR